ncbi:LacI family DNA-binding transcriptional regulator [Streptomyces glaucescens]|uniref:DNA-binding protein n=1 Tax=Streptomyces glaucescens TaxID=1907 RepID=A0A089XEH0_STRGA|nr:LacI family DNA-binding transcriptional regulator [Streptomyces glaucescens]AIS01669.1 DNA-binding protein [Streptomyces glaucescens]
MGHPFPLREIARQAGLSEATVDRVLNGRGGVRPSTAQEVHRAVTDLERQRTQVRLAGRTFMVDMVMQAPNRFTSAVRAALEAELPGLHPAVLRCRFHFRETGPVEEQLATLDRIARRGSQGVILKAPDVPEVTAAVGRLAGAGIPVVTLVTDLPASARIGYVGIDNRAAGATAAYLLGQWLGDRPAHVLTSLSSGRFRNEEEREAGFRATLRARHPGRTLVGITEGHGLDATQYDLVRAALDRHPEIRAVYSIGGGNPATLRAFEDAGRDCAVFVAHDLDRDNTRLLREHRLSAVLHHDLRHDLSEACRLVLRAHGALPPAGPALPSPIQVVTPYNLPPAVR